MKIYMAGPLFTKGEIDFNVALKNELASFGHHIHLPQEHEPREKTARAIFEADVEGIDWADLVLANMDGPDPDSGTCWECGYAYKKKPVIIYRTDFRNIVDYTGALVNLMLTESSDKSIGAPFKSVHDLAVELDTQIRQLFRDKEQDCKHFWVGTEVDAISIKEGYTGFNFNLKCIQCGQTRTDSKTFNGVI